MKFTRQPVPRFSSLIVAALMAAAGASAIAQTALVATPPAPGAGAPEGHSGGRMGRHDPAKMQAMKAKLSITPAQEDAWAGYQTAMQPPANMGGRPTPEQRAEFDKLTTPERIDKMRAMRTQRMTDMSAAMDKRGEATKTFYSALTPAQQKVFDAEHKKLGRHTGEGGRGGPGHHGAAGPMKG